MRRHHSIRDAEAFHCDVTRQHRSRYRAVSLFKYVFLAFVLMYHCIYVVGKQSHCLPAPILYSPRLLSPSSEFLQACSLRFGNNVSCSGRTVTLPGSVRTIYSTIVESGHATTVTSVSRASCSASPIGPITNCATTLTETSYISKPGPGYNTTAVETSVITAPGRTVTAYE